MIYLFIFLIVLLLGIFIGVGLNTILKNQIHIFDKINNLEKEIKKYETRI